VLEGLHEASSTNIWCNGQDSRQGQLAPGICVPPRYIYETNVPSRIIGYEPITAWCLHVFCARKMHVFVSTMHYYYYWYSALGPVWAETRAQSVDWYSSGTLHPGQVLRGSLPLLSPAFRRSHFRHQVPQRRERS